MDTHNSELGTRIEGSRTWTGVLIPTLRRERVTRRRILEHIEGEVQSSQISLDKDEVVVGRAPDADIRLTTKKASRHHAYFRARGADCVVIDNDSHNGVTLNGIGIHSAVLRDGDVIHLAENVFVYRED